MPGRYFFAHRRVFGRVAISRETNPNLKDKAGREGLVENRARREMQLVVTELLIDFAQRFFGSDAPLRKEYLPRSKREKGSPERRPRRYGPLKRVPFASLSRQGKKTIAAARSRVDELKSRILRVADARDSDGLTVLGSEFRELVQQADDLQPPMPPRKLGNLEEPYRQYRDDFQTLTDGLTACVSRSRNWTRKSALATHSRRCAARGRKLGCRRRLARQMDVGPLRSADALRSEWAEEAGADRNRYRETINPYLQEPATAATLVSVLNLLDMRRSEIEEDLRRRYDSLVRSLDRLQEGIDLEGALSVIDDDRAELEDRLKEINQVAQLGIAVEIIGHELETLDAEVRSNLGKLPPDVKNSRAFRLAYEAHSSLTEKLKFLSPLKIAGYRNRETITGGEIADYVRDFFERRLGEARVSFQATEAFQSVSFTDLRSRIYPVFVNLVNNCLYWLSFVSDRADCSRFRGRPSNHRRQRKRCRPGRRASPVHLVLYPSHERPRDRFVLVPGQSGGGPAQNSLRHTRGPSGPAGEPISLSS